jgi:hypothetical protein
MSYDAQNLQSVVNELLLLPDGDNLNGGLIPSTVFYDKILKNVNYGGGDKIKVPIAVKKHTVSVGTDPYVASATSPLDQAFNSLSFDYKLYSASDLISEVEIGQSSGTQAANILKAKLSLLKASFKDKINNDILTTEIPGFWGPSTYGGITIGTGVAGVLADDAAYNLVNWARFNDGATGAAPTAVQTYWDANSNSSPYGLLDAISDENELVVKIVSTLYNHIAESGDEPDVVLVAKDVYERFLDFTNNKVGGVNYGAVKSITATDGSDVRLYGAVVLRDSNIPAGTAYVLNTKYIHFCSPTGFAPKTINPVVSDYSAGIRVKQIGDIIPLKMICRNTVRQGMVVELP